MRTPASFLLLLFAFAAQISARSERIVLVAGGGDLQTGPAESCKLRAPFGVVQDKSRNLYIVEYAGGEQVLRIDPRGQLSVIAGTGEKGGSGDGGPALQARFNSMHNLSLGPGGSLLLADSFNHRIRKLDLKSGKILPFAGTGKKGFSGDNGPAGNAEFGDVYCLAADRGLKNLYVADLDNRRIRAIDLKSGMVRTVAGNGAKGAPQNGAIAVESPLVDPRAVAVDSRNNIYILERSGHALRVVSPDGKIRTVAGTGRKGSGGDGGDALSASFNGPKHLWVDKHDDVLIADSDNHVIRKFLPREGKVVRVAGTGKAGSAGIGGSPLEAELNQPHGVYEDSSGTIYISDSTNNRVLKIVK